MLKKWIVVCLCLCGCSSKPENLLSKSEMVNCLIEIHLAEARVQQANIPTEEGRNYFLPKEKALLEQSGRGDSILIKSYQYYLLHPKELEEIYDHVIDSLSLREAKLTKPEKK